jgi:hypothetical protein
MKKLILFGLLVLLGCSSPSFQEMYEGAWTSADGKDFANIAATLGKNGIPSCGEFYYKKNNVYDQEYLTACTDDGTNWTYYFVWPSENKVVSCEEKIKHP